VTFDLYVWSSPRDLDAAGAAALLQRWNEAGGDPAASPFEPSTDLRRFHRELTKDVPGIVTTSDAIPDTSTTPIFLAAAAEPPARIVAVKLSPYAARETLEEIHGLATRHDLVVFDARSGALHLPLQEMAAHADARFWPRGAIQAAVGGAIGAAIAVVAWLVGIPILSGVLIVVGVFLLVMSVYRFVHMGRRTVTGRRRGGAPPRT
jgi:hypothetical protein